MVKTVAKLMGDLQWRGDVMTPLPPFNLKEQFIENLCEVTRLTLLAESLRRLVGFFNANERTFLT